LRYLPGQAAPILFSYSQACGGCGSGLGQGILHRLVNLQGYDARFLALGAGNPHVGVHRATATRTAAVRALLHRYGAEVGAAVTAPLDLLVARAPAGYSTVLVGHLDEDRLVHVEGLAVLLQPGRRLLALQAQEIDLALFDR